jgi:hypothetical protein
MRRCTENDPVDLQVDGQYYTCTTYEDARKTLADLPPALSGITWTDWPRTLERLKPAYEAKKAQAKKRRHAKRQRRV